MPEEILDDPRVEEFDISFGFPILTIVVGGNIAETQMRDIAENLKDEISDIKNIASVRMAGLREREIWIEVNPDRLKAYQLPNFSGHYRARNKQLESPRRHNENWEARNSWCERWENSPIWTLLAKLSSLFSR